MRIVLFLCLLSSCAVTAAGCSGRSSACAPPSLEAEPAHAAPGEAFVLRGEDFFDGCNDDGRGSPDEPERNVRINFRQGSETWTLATVDAGPEAAFDERLRVPANAEPGQASVSAHSEFSGTIQATFRVLDRGVTHAPTGAASGAPPAGRT